MSFFSVNVPQTQGRPQVAQFEQLRDFYRIPRFINDAQLVDLSAVTSNVFLGQTAEDLLILAQYRPIYLNNKLIIESDILISNSNCIQPPKLLCQLQHPGIPVQASYIRGRMLAVVFLFKQSKILQYQLVVFFPQRFSHKFDCSKSSFRSFHVFPAQEQPIQAYILMYPDQTLQSSHKQFKISHIEVGKQYETSDRFIVLTANQSVSEFQVSYTYFDISPEYKNSQNKELLLNINRLYSLSLKNPQNFGIISAVKVVNKICDCETLQEQICYLAFNSHQADLVILTRNAKAAPRGMLCCKLYLYKLVAIVDKQTSMRQLQTFTTPYLPLEKYQFQYFDSMDLLPNAVRPQYHALSALNNVLTLEYIDQKEGKLVLIAVHLHLGSTIQISLPSSLFSKGKVLNPQFDQDEQAELIVQFLLQNGRIHSNEQMEYTDMYQALFAKNALTRTQPYIISLTDCFIWIAPNYTTNRMSVYLIKALPYTPMEKVFDTSVPLTQQHLAKRIQSFISGTEMRSDGENANESLYDVPLRSPPNKEISFDLDFGIFGSVESTQDYVGIPSESQITDFEYNNTYSVVETEDSIFQSIIEDGCDPSTTSITSPLSSLIVSEQLRRKPRQALFKGRNSIPLFSQQELSTYLILNFIFRDKQLILAPQNYLFYKSRFQNVLQPSNNIFYYVEFFKAIKQDTLETFEYLNSPYSEISLFAVSQRLFTHKLFDTTDLTVKYITLHPRLLMESSMNLVKQHNSIVYQNVFSQLLRFLTEMVQQIVQVYKLQVGEFFNVIRLIWGQEIYTFTEGLQDGQQNQELITVIFDWYISNFEDKQSTTQIQLRSNLLLSILYFSSVIKRILTQQGDRAGDIQALPFEHYISEYIVYQQAFARLSSARRQPRIYKLTPRPSIVEWNNQMHPIAKQYCYSQYLAQSVFKWLLEGDNILMTALNLDTEDAIKQLTQQFDDLVCYRVFDRNFSQIMLLIRHMSELQSKKQYKDAIQEMNQCSAGTLVIQNLARQSAFVNRQLQQFVQPKRLYERLLSSNSFTLQLASITELVEAVQITQNYTDIIGSNRNVPKNKFGFFPQWLQNMILSEFNDNDLTLQAGFQYVELCEVGMHLPILEEYYQLLYNRSKIIQPLEYQFLSGFRPIALKKRQERIQTRLRAGSALKSSPHMLVKWALQDYQRNEVDLQQNLQNMPTLDQVNLIQQYELFSSILKGETQVGHLYQKLSEMLPPPYSGGRPRMKAGGACDAVRLRLSPFAKQRVLSFYQRAEIFEFQRAGKAVNRDEYYQILSTQGYESMYQVLGGVGLYLRDFDEKRKVGQLLRGQFGAEFAKVVEQLLDDVWE